jgi:TldD protein
MLREWELGKTVGQSDPQHHRRRRCPGNGYTPYDDEGTKARKNYIIRDGKLVGRLHSTATATDLRECLTGKCQGRQL